METLHAPARKTGRPTRAAAMQLGEDLRVAALALFLERGYEGTTLDAIARAAGTTKPSLYIRFPDKGSLFEAVVRWAIGQPDWPVPETEPPDLDDLEGALRSIADSAVRRVTNPSMVGLNRLVVAQAERFPDLAEQTLAATTPRTSLIVELLQRHSALRSIVVEDPEILAEQFLDAVSARAARSAAFGVADDAVAERRYADINVKMFLRGLRPS